MYAWARTHWKRLWISLGALVTVAPSHTFSLASALILASFFYLALTSSSFVQDGGTTADLLPSAPRSAEAAPVAYTGPTERWHVYYLITDVAQQRSLLEAINRDAQYRAEQGGSVIVENVSFLFVRDPDEEGWAARLINTLAEASSRDGYNLKVVDLRMPSLDLADLVP